MKLSDLSNRIAEFIAEHGDLEIYTEYWCDSCSEWHDGEGIEIEEHTGYASGEKHAEVGVIKISENWRDE